MRNTIATLTAVVAGMAVFGSTAGQAAADDPNAWYSQGGYAGLGSHYLRCETPNRRGVLGQFGAWGYYIDGCTAKLSCDGYFARYCDTVSSETKIDTLIHRGDRVTMNARLRVFDSSGRVIWYRDQSCSGVDSCATTDLYTPPLSLGQSASIQCNGVREAGPSLDNNAKVSCRLQISRR